MKNTRVLLAKVGLDGHDRGLKLVAHYLMEAGMEVIYLGLRQTPEQVVSAALEEDVDVVGLSFLAGDHLILAPRVLEGLKRSGLEEVMVLVGGIVLERDVPRLEAMGVRKVFLPGTPPGEIVNFIQGAAT
ncbi:MAG: cobalamin B12-binding domain-containing protein [Betaproteobacteria bacterium]|nr:MAG: cobalamin B12-binding domain-containing protein [Betaproteobacteria bacterium]